MQLRRHILRFLTVIATLLLVSCIDGREEYWLNANGSGRADLTYSLPAAAASFQGGEAGVNRMLGDFLKNTPAITTSSHEVTTRDGRLTVHLLATFDSVLELRNISKGASLDKLPSSASGLTGSIDLGISGRTAALTRVIDAGKALPGSSFLPSSQFEGRGLTYIVHLPLAASESNATTVANAGRTLTWDFPLRQAIRGPQTIHFKAPVPVPAWLLGIAGAGILCSVGLASFALRRGRRKRSAQPAP